MASTKDGILKKTGKKLSALVFETTKQSRMLKKRMRMGALRKSLKACYRDLGHLYYAALKKGNAESLELDAEIRALVAKIDLINGEIDWLRESISRIARLRKTFPASRGKSAGKSAAVAEGEPPAVMGRKAPKAQEALREALAAQVEPLSPSEEARRKPLSALLGLKKSQRARKPT